MFEHSNEPEGYAYKEQEGGFLCYQAKYVAKKIIEQFKDGQIIAIGGQTGRCMPDRLIDCVFGKRCPVFDNLLIGYRVGK